MTTIPARRKHGACLLRIKENCPFRKLRKNRCYDVTATSSVNGGVLWTDYSEHPISASSDQPIIAISGEPLPPLPTYQAHYRHQHLQGPVAMDMEDIVQGPSPKIGAMRPNPSSGLTPRSLLPILTPPNSESSMGDKNCSRSPRLPISRLHVS